MAGDELLGLPLTKKFAATRGKADVQLGEISLPDHSISFREYLAKKRG